MMYHTQILDQNHDQNSCYTSTQVTPMKATIIYSSPFLHSCKNVPASNTNTTTATATTLTSRTSGIDNSRFNSSNSNGSSSSCCHREHKKYYYYYYYEKHATQRISTTPTPTSTPTPTPIPISTSTAAIIANSQHAENMRRNFIRERRRNLLHANCCSSQIKAQTQSVQKMDTLTISQKYLKTAAAAARTTPTSLHPRQQKYGLNSSSSRSNNNNNKLNTCSDIDIYHNYNTDVVTAFKDNDAGNVDNNENNDDDDDQDVDNVASTIGDERLLKTNSRLADNIKLRNLQLVMPIGESRLGNMTVDDNDDDNDDVATSTATSKTRFIKNNNNNSNNNTNSNNIYKHNNNNNYNYPNDNETDNSQTTTLECRCFKDNRDIMVASIKDNYTSDDVVVTSTNSAIAAINVMAVDKNDEKNMFCCSSSIYDQLKFPSFKQLQKQQQHIQSWLRSQNLPARLLTKTTAATISTTRLLLTFLMLLMLTSTANCWTARLDVLSNCTFPARWEGSWFLSGYQQSIHIKGSQFSYRGKCAASDGNKYLIVDEKGCHRCLVIYEKHKNVLQYKESECEGDSMYGHQSSPSAMAMRSVLKQNGGDHRGGAHPNSNGHSRLSSSDQYIMRSNDDMNDCPSDFCKGRETLQNLCDQIPGDALLYSLFRESAEPVKCPLKGPFVFTYNRGHGECKSPVSNIESCTEDSRLLLSFQACPDVQGTESTVEELTCLATWKDGNSRYLVGLVSHHHAISNEERYRCFVYEKISSLMGGPSIVSSKDAEYKLAQSGDATCNGLDSAEVGSRIMSLRKPPLAERCDFPVWFKGPRHWHALMGNAVYNYHSNDGSVHIIKPNGYMETRALCEQINKQTSTEMMAVVHYTTGCQSGFMCMMFYRRDTHVIEIQTGKQASRLEDACAPDHFDINRMPYITLLASNPDPQICPMEGLYNLRGAIGPPYLTTRHKRNHNNKVHGAHGHHHQIQSQTDTSAVGADSSVVAALSVSNNAHKKLNTMSFRNLDRVERSSWQANTRGLTIRNRRNVLASTPTTNAYINNNEDQHNVIESADVPNRETQLTADVDMRQRNRRDTPGCITNFKAQRQLLIGCTEPNVIDVRPMCNEDGDEEYSCHGSWTENGTVYIIARHKGTKHGVCISYRSTEGNAAKLVIGDACYRGILKPPEHHLVANLSVFGKCGDTSSHSIRTHTSNSLVVTLAVAILTTLLRGLLHLHPSDMSGILTLSYR